jgi:hypothetical protein
MTAAGRFGPPPSDIRSHVAAVHITVFVQPFEKTRQRSLINSVGRSGADKPDDWHRWLLRSRREGPSQRAAKSRNELAPFHVWMAPAWQEIM